MESTDTLNRISKPTKEESRIRKGYFLAFLLLAVVSISALYMNRRLAHHAEEVENTYVVIHKLEVMVSRLKDGENGVRGYLISKSNDFLSPYLGSYQEADSIYTELITLISDNPLQQQRLADLRPYLDKRAGISRFNIDEFERNNKEITDTMRRLLPITLQVMAHIREQVGVLKNEEFSLLEQRDKKFKASITALNTITIAALLMAIFLVTFGFLTYTKKNKALRKAGAEIDDYQAELKNRIGELNKANAELVRMRNQEKFAATGRMARTIAHEVRNPLTNINLAAEHLEAEIGSKFNNTAYLFEMITRNSSRINQLISDLLDSTKFTELNFESTDINALLDEAMQHAEDRIALTNIKVIKRYSKDMIPVSVDKGRMKLAFLNLIINALEAMEEKDDGRLLLETKTERGRCQVTISDNGSGMDDDSLVRLFEPYFTTRPKGNGLGLTNTQNIILNHKGEIFVESQRGVGTSFTILLDPNPITLPS